MKKYIPFIVTMTCLISSVQAQQLQDGSWTWVKGSDTVKQNAVFGVKTVPDPTNDAGGRSSGGTWTDNTGKFWVFGGRGFRAASIIPNYSNDLWKFDPATNEWSWMSGDSTLNGAGSYRTKGVTAAANLPPNRYRFPTWTDAQGNLWLFGGTGNIGNRQLNDLWKYDIATHQWTWISGNNTQNTNGIYNTSLTAFPGAREGAAGWVDNNGNFWIYGGYGRAASNTASAYLNDLWKFDPVTQVWTWVNGASTTNVVAVYGTKGVAAPTNNPGNRRYASYWKDANGNLWLFGGDAYNNFTFNRLNDLWKFDPNTLQWTWVSGDATAENTGVYGTRLQPGTANKPGARMGCGFWNEPDGKHLWLFGGSGLGATGDGYLNDLWLYTIATNEWTWISGDTAVDKTGIYGTQGVPDPANVPGGRYTTAGGWSNGRGRLWLYGGDGRGKSQLPTLQNALLNDVWKFEICFSLNTLSAINGPDTICHNTAITYSVPPVDGAEGYSWILPSGWSGSSTTEQITVTTGNTGGTITVKAFNYCDTQIVVKNVFVPSVQTAQQNKEKVCPGELFNIIPGNPLPYVLYKWYLNDWTNNIGNQNELRYAISTPCNDSIFLVTFDGHCRDTLSFPIQVVPALEMGLSTSKELINYGESVTLNTQANVPYQATQWSPPYLFPNQTASSQTFQPDSSRIYIVFGKSLDGCIDSASVKVNIIPVIFLPNAFSPNGDGVNDYFKPFTAGDDVLIQTFNVFNRFGQSVYNANGKQSSAIKGWDGKQNGVPADVGTYFFDVKIITPYGKKFYQKGDVQLIR
jgi:gliding motility-associated-like protein